MLSFPKQTGHKTSLREHLLTLPRLKVKRSKDDDDEHESNADVLVLVVHVYEVNFQRVLPSLQIVLRAIILVASPGNSTGSECTVHGLGMNLTVKLRANKYTSGNAPGQDSILLFHQDLRAW